MINGIIYILIGYTCRYRIEYWNFRDAIELVYAKVSTENNRIHIEDLSRGKQKWYNPFTLPKE